MDVGLLWYEHGSIPLETSVREAAAYYLKKYGKSPDLCFIHPATGNECQVDGIAVKHSRSQLPNHFWIGVNSPQPVEDDWKTRERDARLQELDDWARDYAP